MIRACFCTRIPFSGRELEKFKAPKPRRRWSVKDFAVANAKRLRVPKVSRFQRNSVEERALITDHCTCECIHVYVYPLIPRAKRAAGQLLLSDISSADITGRNISYSSFLFFLSLFLYLSIYLSFIFIISWIVSPPLSLSCSFTSTAWSLSLRIRLLDENCWTRQMAAERVTEARVTNVCRCARKCGARKLLVSVRLDPPAIPPDARRRGGATRARRSFCS